MIAVIFEVTPAEGQQAAYLDIAAEMRLSGGAINDPPVRGVKR